MPNRETRKATTGFTQRRKARKERQLQVSRKGAKHAKKGNFLLWPLANANRFLFGNQKIQKRKQSVLGQFLASLRLRVSEKAFYQLSMFKPYISMIIPYIMVLLSQNLSSKVKAELFRILFGLSDNPLHMRELARRSGYASSREAN